MLHLKEVKETVRSVAKLGIPLSSLYEKAVDIQDLCTDFEVDGREIDCYLDEFNRIHVMFDDTNKGLINKSLTRYSFGQLCAKVGVPYRYLDKCISLSSDNPKYGDLAIQNLSTFLENYNKSFLIRAYEDHVRGVVSGRFMTLDAPDILTVLGEVIDESQYATKGYFLSPERFHARIVQKTMMSVKGEDLFAGIQVDSSDVGRSVLSVRFFIYKQVCANGMCIEKAGGILFKQKHIGINLKDFRDSFRESMKEIPRLVIEFEQHIRDTMKSGNLISKDAGEEEVKAFLNQVENTIGVSPNHAQQVLDLMRTKYSLNKWGYINSITELSQKFSLEKRLQLERDMGNLLVA